MYATRAATGGRPLRCLTKCAAVAASLMPLSTTPSLIASGTGDWCCLSSNGRSEALSPSSE
eukprot:scaffold682194_cov111-Prasinocladus_malaysianus.AAC.1